MLSFGHFFPNEKDLKRAISRLLVEVFQQNQCLLLLTPSLTLLKSSHVPMSY